MAIGRGIYRYLAAEHVIVVFMIAYSSFLPSQTQYIEKRIVEQLAAADRSSGGCTVNKSSPEYRLGEMVQQESSIWSLYLMATLALTVMFSANIWGALSDKYGRHVAFIMPCVGLAVNAVVNLVVVHFSLPLYVLIFGSLAQGICGDYTTFVVGCAGYNADVTVPDSRERTIRFILVDVISLLTGTVCQLVLGFVITTYGFVAPYLAVIGLITIAAIFIIFSLPDRRIIQPSGDTAVGPTESPSNPLNVLKNIHSLFALEKRRGWFLAGYNFVAFGVMLFAMTWPAINVLYTTAEPFCMDPLNEGYYQAAMSSVYGVGTLIGGAVVSKILSTFWTMHLSLSSLVLSLVITAFAYNYPILYLGTAAGIFGLLVSPLIRTNMANLLDSSEQGVLFAFNGCLTSLSGFLSPLIFNAIYSGTLHFMRGFVYLTMALVALICWGVIVLLHIFEPSRRKGYMRINEQGITGTEDDSEACSASF